MKAFWLFFFISMGCFIPHISWAKEPLVIGHFSAQPQEGVFPENWKPLEFKGVDMHTVYTHVLDGGTGVMQAESKNSSSGLVRKIEIIPTEYPTISFRWKIQDIIANADLTHKAGGDAPARVYITFAYNSQQVSWWEVVKFETLKLLYGEYPPIAALTYVWASQAPKGTVMTSPYTSRIKIIVLESGDDKKGQWVAEKRNIVNDYHMAFDTEEVPIISGVAILTDSDNTGKKAVAWYGDIVFSE